MLCRSLSATTTANEPLRLSGSKFDERDERNEPMNSLQRSGGVAALIAAATYVVGMVLLFSVLAPSGYGMDDADPAQIVGFLAANQVLMYSWNLIIYVVNAICLVVLSLALFERLRDGAPGLAQVATAFGLIWATLVLGSGMIANINLGETVALFPINPEQAAEHWKILDTVEEGLGGGNEIVGSLWVVLLSWAALRSAIGPRVLNFLGLVIGVAGLATIVPVLSDTGAAIFGLGFIVWFIWIGIVLLGRRSSVTLFAATDTIHRGLHVVIDAASWNAAEDAERMKVRVEQHLVGLKRVSPHQERPAV